MDGFFVVVHIRINTFDKFPTKENYTMVLSAMTDIFQTNFRWIGAYKIC
jgi:hypothetical protein